MLSIVHELLKARKIDLDYLIRYSNAPWLVIDAPGTAEHGLFARDEDGKPLLFETVTERVVPAGSRGARPSLSGKVTLPDGRSAVPVLHLLAEKYLDAKYAPEAVAPEIGVAADTIRGLAAEIAKVAFEEAIVIEQPWTDIMASAIEFCRTAGIVSCHARNLGPFQRLPDGARAASPADSDRLDRLSRRLPLQAALSEAGGGASDAAWRPSTAPTSRCRVRISDFRAGRRIC